ncbi:MAG: sulfate adenylyltransferase [Candidatus Omnitrophica bacterium CG11_big_fil_rev_8_21_14_0_20_63_9]|nr:MAG: sulfate adenylyltransferase [Candidatus Omnitrophica bacterium CG11_big_fil_rev_8_21_14_0_20_63_9]
MIAPHGGTLVNRIIEGGERDALLKSAQRLPKLELDAWGLSDVEMIAIGGFSPLTGFLGKADYESVVTKRRLANGLVWTIPVTLAVPAAQAQALKGDVALTSGGTIIAVLHQAEAYAPDKTKEAEQVFRTTESAHPGVARLQAIGDTYLGGRLSVLNRPKAPTFAPYRLDPKDTRALFEQRGWRRIVAFQTRNPIHRAHEYIQKCALEICDGMLLHPIVGETKGDDVPAAVRMKCYEVLLANYYPKDRVVLAVNPASMRYGGPREAVFHALIRKNYGCTHFIVGRDHAGVGKYYGTYDAQKIFEDFTAEEIGITPLNFENTAFCTVCGGMVSSKTCPHPAEKHVSLSGTKVRELLQAGTPPPLEISRPEVAAVLIEAMRGQAAAAAR